MLYFIWLECLHLSAASDAKKTKINAILTWCMVIVPQVYFDDLHHLLIQAEYLQDHPLPLISPRRGVVHVWQGCTVIIIILYILYIYIVILGRVMIPTLVNIYVYVCMYTHTNTSCNSPVANSVCAWRRMDHRIPAHPISQQACSHRFLSSSSFLCTGVWGLKQPVYEAWSY